MHCVLLLCNAPITLQVQLPSGQKSRSNAPPISNELPLLKDKFRLQSNTLHAFQREKCRNDTFKLLLKTLLKELSSLTKTKFHLVNPSKPKTTCGRITSEHPVQILAFQSNVQIPPSPGTMHGQMPGGGLQFRIDRRISIISLSDSIIAAYNRKELLE